MSFPSTSIQFPCFQSTDPLTQLYNPRINPYPISTRWHRLRLRPPHRLFLLSYPKHQLDPPHPMLPPRYRRLRHDLEKRLVSSRPDTSSRLHDHRILRSCGVSDHQHRYGECGWGDEEEFHRCCHLCSLLCGERKFLTHFNGYHGPDANVGVIHRLLGRS